MAKSRRPEDITGPGLRIARKISGEVVLRDTMTDILPRLDLLEKLNDRFEHCLHTHDKDGLLELALEYEKLGAKDQASRIRFRAKKL